MVELFKSIQSVYTEKVNLEVEFEKKHYISLPTNLDFWIFFKS